MYLYLSSKGDPGFDGVNQWYDFYCTLSEPLLLDPKRDWRVSIMELYIQDKVTKNYDGDLLVYIKSDLAKASYVDRQKEPILAACTMKDCLQTVKSFKRIFNVPCAVDNINTVHLYISPSQGSLPSLDDSAVTRVTLLVSEA